METIFISYLFDSRLSLDAKGLLSTMLEEPSKKYSIASLANCFVNDSKETITTALIELLENGYIAIDKSENNYYVIRETTKAEENKHYSSKSNKYNSNDIANRIKALAKSKGISINELLANCQLGINTVSKIAAGKDIHSKNLAKIADYLNCSVDYLLGRTDDPNLYN